MDSSKFKVFDTGMLQFQEAVRLQLELVQQVRQGSLTGALVVCSHHPVITLGRNAKKEHVKASAQELERRNIAVYPCQRGGDVTYHGPGQIVLYPVVDLRLFHKDLHWFLRSLETWAIGVLAETGIAAAVRANLTGVWVGMRKIASIGVGVKDWVTFHGMAVNVFSSDLDNFSLIRACGLDSPMTSVEKENGYTDKAALIQTFIRRCPYV